METEASKAIAVIRIAREIFENFFISYPSILSIKTKFSNLCYSILHKDINTLQFLLIECGFCWVIKIRAV